ncbi:hypothetical protein DSL64_03770 [Dyadobacter luteus]|uniref:Uncharacterized protein n=1 Tax=Dyadobacter luteus TaxID=2259619 RepID=A0A3D8YFY6_9BACT|nr:O-methyltransferase [Dyadobacter luteus]REA63571.1 hypothetical protein DSL64_03770 [Dyadobacter luteus]
MSFRKINYKLRPAKTVERKMITESFRKLSAFNHISDYQYIGFGSIYFVDFVLFHKHLGIKKMISIEKDANAQSRVEFNKPFSCIDMHFDTSSNVLPKLELDRPSIIWLDYDGKLSTDCLSDLSTTCSNLAPGSVLMATLNVQAESIINIAKDEKQEEGDDDEIYVSVGKEEIFEHRLKILEEQISRYKIPADIEAKDLTPNGLPKLIARILENEISSALDTRNLGLDDTEYLYFKQLYNIKYEDGAAMLTFGGIIVSADQLDTFDSANFFELPYCTPEKDAFHIKIPNLTTKEVVLLDSQIHEAYDFKDLSLKAIPKPLKFINSSEIKSYAEIYRFYPTFTESIW